MAFDWGAAYRARWRVYEVNPLTWADAGLLAGVTQMSVTRDIDGDAPLVESGSVNVDAPVGEDFRERYLRIVMVAEQDGLTERVDVATLHFSSAGGEVDRGVSDTELVGRSVLWPASTERLTVGSYAPRGADGAAYAASMLSSTLTAPVYVAGSFTLDQHMVFDRGSSILSAVWALLGAGGFTLLIGGDGSVTVAPRPVVPSLTLDRANARLLIPGMGRRLDLSGVPNRYTAVDGDQVAEVVNDDPSSPTSTVERGYVHDGDCPDTSPTRVNGETLTAYAARRLEEESTVDDEYTYSREWWPGVLPGCVVRGSLPSVGFEGDMRVKRQRLTLGRGIVVEEESAREVVTWRRG